MLNNNTRRLCVATIIIVMAIVAYKTSFPESPKPQSKEVVIRNYGVISNGETSITTTYTPSTQPSGFDIFRFLVDASRAITALSVIIGAMAGLAKWLQKRAKNSRRPAPYICEYGLPSG